MEPPLTGQSLLDAHFIFYSLEITVMIGIIAISLFVCRHSVHQMSHFSTNNKKTFTSTYNTILTEWGKGSRVMTDEKGKTAKLHKQEFISLMLSLCFTSVVMQGKLA